MDINEETYQLFNNIAWCFTYKFYITLYEKSKVKWNTNQHNTLTEIYRDNCLQYVSEIAKGMDGRYYKQMLVDLHDTYTRKILRRHISSYNFTAFINDIVKSFVPKSHINKIRSNDKDFLVYNVLTNTLKSFVRTILKDYLSKVIDERNEMNSKKLRSVCTEIITAERTTFYTKFIDIATKNTIDSQRSFMTALIQKNKELKMKCKQLEERIAELEDKLTNVGTTNTNFGILDAPLIPTSTKDKKSAKSAKRVEISYADDAEDKSDPPKMPEPIEAEIVDDDDYDEPLEI